MNDADKREFLDVLVMTGEIYDQSAHQVRKKSPIYWEALRHRQLSDVKVALNAHVRDPERGRFFPKPADIEAQLPNSGKLWLSADEAWAMCPKDEIGSAAMTREMSQALHVASDLLQRGDHVAARMAFKGAYDRLVNEAKAEGREPEWFASLGYDKEGRHRAEVKVVEMQNMALPADKRKALPVPEERAIGVNELLLSAPEHVCSKETVKENLEKLYLSLGVRKRERSESC